MRDRFFRALADVVCRRPWWIAGWTLLLAVGSGLYAHRRLEFKTGRTDLIGHDSEYWRLFSEYKREFQAEEDYLLVVESDDPLRNRRAVDALTAALLAPANNSHPGDSPRAQQFRPEDVFGRVDYQAFQQWFLYYLSTNDLALIRDSLKDFNQLVTVLQHKPKLDTFFDAMNQMLQQMRNAPETERRAMEGFVPTITALVRQVNEFETASEKWPLLSPWANALFSEEMVGVAEQQLKWQGYHAFRDGRTYVVIVHPSLRGDISGPDHHAATVPKLRRIIREVQPQFPDVRVSLTGEPVLDTDEMFVSRRDALKSSVLTVVLVGIVVVLGFRDWLRMLLSIGCLIQVIFITMGYATLVIGHLNIITITFAVMILGLGEDLGVQFISRYEEELSGGADRFGAVRGALRFTGPSIVTAGVTNAAAFFAMGLSGFLGVTELGIIAGGGMLLATVGMTVALPALILSVRRRNEPARILARAHASAVEQVLLRRPQWTLAICALLTAGALLVGWRMRFDYNVLNLQSRGLESVETELRLLRADAESTIYASVVTDNLEQTRELHQRLTNLTSVATVHSIAELIPEQQERKAPIIRDIRERVGNVRFDVAAFQPEDAKSLIHTLGALRLRASQVMREASEGGNTGAVKVLQPLVDALRVAREKVQALEAAGDTKLLGAYERRFYEDLEAQLKLLADQADRPMQVSDLPQALQLVLVGKTGKFLIRVFPKENIWERGPLERFVRDVRSVAPKATGTPLGLYEFIDILLKGYIRAAVCAFFVIAIMVWADLRSVAATVLTLVPLVAGLIWMMGAMAVFGIKFNPANVLTLPLMVGIGVAYGIYIVRRYREDGEATFYGKSTGRAVMLSALTAVIAFASLLIGAHRGIGSLGLVMSIGITACLTASLTLLPALLEIARRKGWKV